MRLPAEITAEITRLPAPNTPFADLTDRDKMALAIAAGEEIVWDYSDPLIAKCSTRYPVGFYEGADGRCRVVRLSDELKKKYYGGDTYPAL